MTEQLAHLVTLLPRISLLPSFSLVFLDLQVKLYLLLANGAHWLQKGCRLLASSINLCVHEREQTQQNTEGRHGIESKEPKRPAC